LWKKIEKEYNNKIEKRNEVTRSEATREGWKRKWTNIVGRRLDNLLMREKRY